MTTTTINLGWSGFSNSNLETEFNKKIVMRTNRVLKKLNISECWLEGLCVLTIGCDYDYFDTIRNIAESFRRADNNNESVRHTADELIIEYKR